MPIYDPKIIGYRIIEIPWEHNSHIFYLRVKIVLAIVIYLLV